MSTSLYWRPTGGRQDLDHDYSLKEALREEYGTRTMTLDADSIPFLRGLRAAKIKGAAFLIEQIDKHGSIEVWEQG